MSSQDSVKSVSDICREHGIRCFITKRKDNAEIIDQLYAFAEAHRAWGFWIIIHRLRKLRHIWNHKSVYLIYTLMRLNLHNKRQKRLPARVKKPLLCPIYPDVTWSLDFMHDTLANGKTLRKLNVIDDFIR